MRGIVALVALTALGMPAGCGGDDAANGTAAVVPVPDGASLGEPGPFGVGTARFETIDRSRTDRLVRAMAYYPASTESGAPQRDAAPDSTGAPYPVVVGDGDIGSIMGPHLASHGFVFVAVQGQSTWGSSLSPDMIDYPLDQMRALDALETLDDHPLAGLADTSRSGVIGYSYGSWDALMLAGARIDPQHYLSTCAARPPGWSDSWWTYICGDGSRWESVVARAEEVGIATADGLWAPFGDDRIKAAMPMGPEGFDLTGPDGLAGVTVPALFIAAGNDRNNEYFPATTSLFAHYPGADLITFAGADHFMIFEPDAVQQMRRFALAFFGLHLLGADGFAQYLTEDFVERTAPGLGATDSFDTLVWGLAAP